MVRLLICPGAHPLFLDGAGLPSSPMKLAPSTGTLPIPCPWDNRHQRVDVQPWTIHMFHLVQFSGHQGAEVVITHFTVAQSAM